MAESGGRPDKPPPEEEDARGGRGADRGGDGGKGATGGIPWLMAGPDGKHSGVKGGLNPTPPRPPKTITSKPSKPGKTINPKPSNISSTSGPSGSSKPVPTGASKPGSHTTPSKPTIVTSTPIRSGVPIRDTTIDLTGNPDDTIIDDCLGQSRTTPDGFVLQPNGKLYNEKTGQTRVPTTEERLAWRILERQAEARLRRRNPPQKEPVENAQDRLKRNASQLSQNSTNPDTAKKTKPNDTKTDDKDAPQTETARPQADNEVGYWNTDAVRLTTVRIISSEGNKLSNNDLTHIGQYHMKACYHNFGTDTEKWDEVAADRVSLVTPYTFAKFKIRTTKGVDFWKQFVPQIPTTTNIETTGAYTLLLPGETMFEEIFFSIAFAELALGTEDGMKMLETAIRVGNPLLRTVKFRLKSTGLDKVSQKTGIVMELLSADRERCFGPKPTDTTKEPKWKLRVGFSTVNATVAYGKAEKRRQDKAKAMEEALSRPPPPPPPPQPTETTTTTTAETAPTAVTTTTSKPAITSNIADTEVTEEDIQNILLDDDEMDEDIVIEETTENKKTKDLDDRILDGDDESYKDAT